MCPPCTSRGPVRIATVLLTALLVLLLTGSNAQAGPAFRGVQLHALWPDVSEADMDRELDLARDANANVVRVDVGWASLEDEAKGKWNSWYLPRLDRLVNGAAARGMRVLPTVWGTPCWASSAPATVKAGCANPDWWGVGVQYPPTRSSDYADIMRFVAARYGAKLAGLEVWNEPNEGKRFINAPDHAVAYAALLKAGYAGVKSGDPSIPVIAGALAKADGTFLARLFAAGIKGNYDALSIHPYNEWRAPAVDGTTSLNSFKGGIAAVHAQQLANGDTTPLWITEFGWTTASGTNWHVNAQQQADYTAQAFGVLSGLPYVQAATVYELRDRDVDPAGFESNFGMVTTSYEPKPAYAALKAALAAPGAAAAAASAAAASAPAATPTQAAAPASSVAGAPGITAAPAPTASDLAPVATATAAPAKTVASGAAPATAAPSSDAARTPAAQAVASTTRKGGVVALSVSTRRVARSVEAVGRAPRFATIRLRVEGCGQAQKRALQVRANGKGRFRRHVGRAAAIRSCRVVASTMSLRATARIA